MKMDGKTVLITGSTDGVGRYVAAKLAAVAANIPIHGRDKARAKSLADDIRRQGYAEPTVYPADLSSLSGARQLAEAVLVDHKRLDLFISNAGIGSRTLGAEHRTSADGHELRFG
jgi:short-subunit dehydrogenase